MPKPNEERKPAFRLQGTDGIRREVKLSTDEEVRGLTPQQAFLERGIITQEFMELYAYAHIGRLMSRGEMKPGDGFVVGWDPRDPKGDYTDAVIRGVRKAKANAIVLGVVPTPLVPAYSIFTGAKGGFMVTASHNPKDQNGIKTFFAFRGMKLLPENDVELTRAVLAEDFKPLRKAPLKGKVIDGRDEALQLFREFSLNPENAWRDGGEDSRPFSDIVLVVDPANGALAGIAADVFRKAGFGRVVEVNAKTNGDVNLFSGVADLEGHHLITREMTAEGSGAFHKHKAVLKLFELGARHRSEIREGRSKVCGAVFDADGDRFFRLDYDPFQDALLVLSGDETAYLQARYLIAREPGRYKNALYINTVESDLNAALAARELGLKPCLTAVGDKWILLRISAMIAEARRKAKEKNEKASLPKKLKVQLDDILKNGALNVYRFLEIEQALDDLRGGTGPSKNSGDWVEFPFAVGSEETGHNITLGRLECPGEGPKPVFFGNGLKSALNTFCATQYLGRGKKPKPYFSMLQKPFKPGFKATYYAYYIRQELFCNESKVWDRVKRKIVEGAKEHGFRAVTSRFPEDPDMLYLSLKTPSGAAGIFVRNSGTENKISVNLRGGKKDAPTLKRIGEQAVRLLLQSMKDENNHYYKLELDVMSQVAGQPLSEDRIVVEKRSRLRLLAEIEKQGLMTRGARGYQLTARGKWYLQNPPE